MREGNTKNIIILVLLFCILGTTFNPISAIEDNNASSVNTTGQIGENLDSENIITIFPKNKPESIKPESIKPKASSYRESELVDESIFSDVIGTPIEEAVQLLTKLNIMKGISKSSFKPEENITRKEFVTALIKIIGYENYTYSDKFNFVDVPISDPSYNSIHLAYSLKIINGFDSIHFAPDEYITFKQAVKMIISALGYDQEALSKGGYFAGYLSVASEKKLLKNIKVIDDDKITRGVAAMLIYNTLLANIPDLTSIGASVKYTLTQGDNLLYRTYKIRKLDGQVTSNYHTSISYQSNNIKENEISLGGTNYKIGDTNAYNYVGYFVNVYTIESDDKDKNTIIMIKENKDKNKTIIIPADKILGNDSKFSTSDIIYEDDKDKKHEIKVLPNARVIRNGKLLNRTTKALDFTPKYGYVEVISLSNDDIYDLIIVTDYKPYVIDSISVENKRVYFKHGGTLNGMNYIDFDDSKLEYLIKKKNSIIEIDKIKEWDTISIAMDEDNTFVKAIISDNRVTGNITEINSSESIVYIDGIEYKFSPYFSNSLLAGTNNYEEYVKLNTNVRFILDIEGKIIAPDMSLTISGRNYGVIIKGDTTSGIDSVGEFMIINTQGNRVILKCEKKINIDSGSGEIKKVPSKDVAAEINFLFNSASSTSSILGLSSSNIRRLIGYDVNSDNKIAGIYFPKDLTNNNSIDANSFSLNYSGIPNARPGSAVVKRLRYILEQRCIIKDSTAVFLIPSDLNNEGGYYSVKATAINSAPLQDVVPKYVELYNMNDNYTPGVILVYEAAPNAGIYINEDLGSILVDRISSAIDEVTGEKRFKIYGLQDNGQTQDKTVKSWLIAEKQYLAKTIRFNGVTTEQIILEEIRKGDLILASFNQKGEINRIVVLQSAQGLPDKYFELGADNYLNVDAKIFDENDSSYNNNFYIYDKRLLLHYGKVKRLIDGLAIVINAYDDGMDRKWNRLLRVNSRTRVYSYNLKTQNISALTVNDLEVGDEILVKTISGQLRDIVIVK